MGSLIPVEGEAYLFIDQIDAPLSSPSYTYLVPRLAARRVDNCNVAEITGKTSLQTANTGLPTSIVTSGNTDTHLTHGIVNDWLSPEPCRFSFLY